MRSQTIDEVIKNLDDIIESAKENKSRLGYFPALYRKVTIRIKKGIEDGLFEDGPRMERLDVIFANRYLEAYDRYQSSGQPTQSWKFAFDATGRWWPIVLQHLLLGMNAHIDLDLGIAAAQTVPAKELPNLQNDFNNINKVLSSLIDEVQRELAQVWPLLKLFDFAAGKFDELLARFGIELARDHAWKVAEEISALPPEDQPGKIKELDQKVANIHNVILRPGFVLGFVLALVRLGELRSVKRIISILE